MLGGFVGGLALGIVPGAAVGEQALTSAKVLAPGSKPAQIGKSVGEMTGGFVTAAAGMTGEVVGTGLSLTGIGAPAGVAAIVASSALVAGAWRIWGRGFGGSRKP